MLPYQMIAGGRFTLNADTVVGVNIQCVSQNPPDFIIARNIGQYTAGAYVNGWGSPSNATAVQWWWERGMIQNSGKGLFQASNAGTPISAAITSTQLPRTTETVDAISVFDTVNPPTYAALTATITNGTTFVVTMASTAGINVGDIVRLYSVTAALQLSGIDFQVTAVTANTSITLGMMATAVSNSAVTAMVNGSAAQVLKFIPSKFYPRWRWIAGITRAQQAKVYFTVANDFTPGEFIGLRIPVAFGSGAWSDLPFVQKDYRVLSVTNSATESSITLDLDTSGFASAFSYPLSLNYKTSPAVCVPSSSGVIPLLGSATTPQEPPGTNLLDAFDNRNTRYIRFGTDLFNQSGFTADTSTVWSWQAFKYDDYKINTF